MTLNDHINIIKCQLFNKDTPKLRAALECLECARKLWLLPGKQSEAMNKEIEARLILRQSWPD